LRNKILLIALVLFSAVFSKAVEVEYRNGKTEKIKKAAFKEKAYLRSKGRNVEINTKKLNSMDVFSDSIEIYYGETWVRADIYPKTKDTVNVPVHEGWIKINTVLTGVADIGKISASITELKRIRFKIPKSEDENASAQGDGQPRTIAISSADGGETQSAEENTETAETAEDSGETAAETASEDENQNAQ